MMVRRRRATAEELAEGERQMKEAQERLSRESQDLPIQDQSTVSERQGQEDARGDFLVPLEGSLAVVEERIVPVSTQVPPGLAQTETPSASGPNQGETREVSRQDAQDQRVILDQESVPPVPNGSPVALAPPRTPVRSTEVEPRQVNTGRIEASTPLFTDHQLRQFETIYQQAPWLYRQPEIQAVRPAWFEQELHVRRLEEEARAKDLKAVFDRVQELERENAHLRSERAGFQTPQSSSAPRKTTEAKLREGKT